jgi:tetratricopeptide (TPR) repeat protein
MQRDRRLMKRAMIAAALLFAAMMLLPMPNFAADPEKDVAKSPEKTPPAAPVFNAGPLLAATGDSLLPVTPEKYREWAGALVQANEPGSAKRMLEQSKTKADPLALAKDLVRRGQYDSASELLEPLLRRSDDPETALLQIACRIMLGQPDLARRPLILLESIRDPKAKEFEKTAALANRLIQMTSLGRSLTVEANPWGVKFLPDKSGTPPKALPPEELAKLPADAEQTLAHWLKLAPMQPAAWAVLGQILFVRGDPSDAGECFKRAKAMGYNSAIIAEYLRILEREEAAKRAAVLKGMSGPPPAATYAEPAPLAVTGSSSRAMFAFGVGGLVVGFLIGVMASKRK